MPNMNTESQSRDSKSPYYKFWDSPDNKNTIVSTSSLEYPFEQCLQCLNSEGVNIDFDDMMRAYDMYLRLMGFYIKPKNADETDLSGGINVAFGRCTLSNYTMDNNESVYKTIMSSGMLMLNMRLNEQLKIQNIDAVVENIDTLIKEFTTLTNEIIVKIYRIRDKFMNTGVVDEYIGMYSCPLKSNTNLSFSVSCTSEGGKFKDNLIYFTSNILGIPPQNPSILYDRLTDEQAEDIKEVFEKEEKKNSKANIIKNRVKHPSTSDTGSESKISE